MWSLAAGLLDRLGQPLGASSPREVFARLASSVPGYAGLDYKSIGAQGRALDAAAGSTGLLPSEARA